MTHVFTKYTRKHGHGPTLRIDSGVQRITVEFNAGYVRIRTSPRGAEVWITRSAFISLIRRSIPLVRKWAPHPDFDVPQAMHQSYLDEVAHLQALRLQKRGRSEDPVARQRQRSRWLAAKKRALRSDQ